MYIPCVQPECNLAYWFVITDCINILLTELSVIVWIVRLNSYQCGKIRPCQLGVLLTPLYIPYEIFSQWKISISLGTFCLLFPIQVRVRKPLKKFRISSLINHNTLSTILTLLNVVSHESLPILVCNHIPLAVNIPLWY